MVPERQNANHAWGVPGRLKAIATAFFFMQFSVLQYQVAVSQPVNEPGLVTGYDCSNSFLTETPYQEKGLFAGRPVHAGCGFVQ